MSYANPLTKFCISDILISSLNSTLLINSSSKVIKLQKQFVDLKNEWKQKLKKIYTANLPEILMYLIDVLIVDEFIS